jgi:hypothetical protein
MAVAGAGGLLCRAADGVYREREPIIRRGRPWSPRGPIARRPDLVADKCVAASGRAGAAHLSRRVGVAGAVAPARTSARHPRCRPRPSRRRRRGVIYLAGISRPEQWPPRNGSERAHVLREMSSQNNLTEPVETRSCPNPAGRRWCRRHKSSCCFLALVLHSLTLLVARNQTRTSDIYERPLDRLNVADDQADRVVHLNLVSVGPERRAAEVARWFVCELVSLVGRQRLGNA